MPTIEITQEQADALARGESIALTAPKPLRYIVASSIGNVWDVETSEPVPVGHVGSFDIKADAKLIAKGPHSAHVGFVQHGIGGGSAVITQIPRRGR